MLVDRSQSRMIPLKIVKYPMQVLLRGRIHRPRHKQLSLGRLLVVNLSKFHFHLQTLLLHQQNIKKNPLHLKVRHPLAKHAHCNQVHLQKHQQKLLLSHQQHLDLACQNHLIQIQNKQPKIKTKTKTTKIQIVYKKQRKTYLNLPIDMMVSIVIPASGGMRWIHLRQRGADLEVDLHPLSAPMVMIAVTHHALGIMENRYLNTREQYLPFGPQNEQYNPMELSRFKG